MTGDVALKACAHCRGVRIVSAYLAAEAPQWAVWCESCGLRISMACKPFDEAARAEARQIAETLWNTRSPVCEDAREELVEALRRLISSADAAAWHNNTYEMDGAIHEARTVLAKSLPSLQGGME